MILIADSSDNMENKIEIIDINYINSLLNKADEVINNNEEVKVEETKTELLLIEDTTPDNKPSKLMEKANSKIEAIRDLEGINIEKIGVWVWIDGDTRAHKDTLKEMGFKYAAKKQMWYYNPDDTYKRRKWSTSYTKQELEEKHGFEVIK